MSFTLYSQSQVASKVARVVRIAGRVEAEVHVIACSILDHIRAHGDTTQALVLLNGLPRGTRVKALAFWFKHYSTSKVIFTFAKEWTVELKKDRTDEDFKISEAMETTFADLTNEKDPVSVTVESILRNLSRNATNTDMHDDGKTPKVSPEARAFASKLVLLAREAGLDPKVKQAA